MRGVDGTQEALFSYVSLDARVPKTHPLRKLKVVVDSILATMSPQFNALYARRGRPSIPPERLLRALLLQVLYSIRSERALMERLDFDLLFRWFVGLGIDERVWERTVFSANRDRLLNESIAREFFRRVVMLAEWGGAVSDEHFSVDGTLIEAWASQKSFVPKASQKGKDDDEPPAKGGSGGGRNEEVDFHGQRRSNETHASTTDPEARLYKKSKGTTSRLCYIGHALSENRNGLVVDAEVTLATGRAEREAAVRMLKRTVQGKKKATLGADKGYDVASFVAEVKALGIKAHVARKKTGSAIDGRTARGKGYQASLRVRKRIEEVFGWAKTVGGLRKTRFIGRGRVGAQALLTFAAYNLTRLSVIWRWGEAPG
jgi:transposase